MFCSSLISLKVELYKGLGCGCRCGSAEADQGEYRAINQSLSQPNPNLKLVLKLTSVPQYLKRKRNKNLYNLHNLLILHSLHILHNHHNHQHDIIIMITTTYPCLPELTVPAHGRGECAACVRGLDTPGAMDTGDTGHQPQTSDQ